MERIDNEVCVSLEIAKLLRKAGFDWKVISYYQHGVFYHYSVDRGDLVVINHNYAPDYMEQYSAPTLDIAERWLREIKHEFVVVHPIINKWFYSIHRPNYARYYADKQFETHEETKEAGIKKILELILKKKINNITTND